MWLLKQGRLATEFSLLGTQSFASDYYFYFIFSKTDNCFNMKENSHGLFALNIGDAC